MDKEKCTIKLNHDCKYCKKAIYINQNPVTLKDGSYHLSCIIEKELADLQGAYDIAMQEIARLRKLLGYDSHFVQDASDDDRIPTRRWRI